MNNKINKSTLKEATAQFEEIKNFALEEAKKNLEDDVSKKVIELMNSSLDGDASTIKEGVTINADGTKITIDDNGDVEIDAEGDIESTDDSVDMDSEMLDMDSEDEEVMVSDEDDEIEIDKSEIKEMNLEEDNFEEQESAAQAPAAAPEEVPTEPTAEAPVDNEVEPGTEEPVEAQQEDSMANPFEALMDKMDQMMSMMGGEAESGGDEIDIIDDTEAAPAPEPAPEPAPAPQEQPVSEEITFEVVNDDVDMDIPDSDEVLEIVGETDEDLEDMDDMEENTMSGQGHAVRRSAGNQDDSHGKTNPEIAAKRKRMNESTKSTKDKAQHEAEIAELIKENESLKSEKDELESELIKFENGFVKLQENFGKMQDYNAKLVMAYKVAMSGGLSTDEKVQISEQFDKCETVKDAENLYKSIVNEHKIKVNKNPEKSMKSTSIKSTPSKSVSKPLYESKEVKRMKQLIGIKKENE